MKPFLNEAAVDCSHRGSPATHTNTLRRRGPPLGIGRAGQVRTTRGRSAEPAESPHNLPQIYVPRQGELILRTLRLCRCVPVACGVVYRTSNELRSTQLHTLAYTVCEETGGRGGPMTTLSPRQSSPTPWPTSEAQPSRAPQYRLRT